MFGPDLENLEIRKIESESEWALGALLREISSALHQSLRAIEIPGPPQEATGREIYHALGLSALLEEGSASQLALFLKFARRSAISSR